MPATYEDTIIPGDEPRIRRKYITGDEFIFDGDRAMAMADTPGAEQWRIDNPDKALLHGRSPFVLEEAAPYQYGEAFGDWARKDGFFGKVAEKGILPGALLGGATGAGLGAVANLIAKWFFPGVGSAGKWALAGGALGGLLGGHNAFVRGRANSVPMLKSSATYTDPRNFILEKLEGANDVGMVEKVKLAAGVKNLDRDSAEKLAALVRSALGFGVGALISKFLFGASGAGALFGGMAGMFGVNFLVNNLVRKNDNPTFDFNFKPLSYRDIL